jgi:hypothetical protein
MNDASAVGRPVQEMLQLGDPEFFQSPWRDYLALGLTQEHIPALLEIFTNEELEDLPATDPRSWASLHAWRALAQLRAVQACVPFLKSLESHPEDDFRVSDSAKFFELLGPAILPELSQVLAEPAREARVRWIAATGMRYLAEKHPETRSPVVACLTAVLERCAENSLELNTGIVCELAALKAVESAAVMERAFAAGVVDETFDGNWEWVQYDMGLRDRPSTPRRPAFAHLFPEQTAPETTAEAPNPAERAKERSKQRRKEARAARKHKRR